MSSRRRSRPGTPAGFNAPPTGRRTPLGALQQNNSAGARQAAKRSARSQPRNSARSVRSHSLPDITEGSRRSSGEAARRRPRPGRKSEVTIDLLRAAPARTHPLGPHRPGSVGSRDGPRHATTNDLWYSRWKEVQPDPSFDIDGDGVVSSFDMAVAREFDKDNNGVLDAEETRLLRTALARKSLQQYSELPHGPQVASLVVKSKNATTIQRTPRDQVSFEPGTDIDPDSQTWHHTMNALQSKIKRAAAGNSKNIQPGIYHTEMMAGNLNQQADAVGGRKGIASLIGGAGEVNHDEHRDDFIEGIGWVDRKDGGNHIDNNAMLTNSDDPIMAAYQDNKGYGDREGMEMKLHDASHAMYDNLEQSRRSSQRPPVHLDGAKPGKLAGKNSHDGVNPKAIRRLFDSMDLDRSGTLDEGEVELLCATAGKRLTKRQLHQAMQSMDADGSGEVDFDEFQHWWTNGVMHPPKGSEVFRQLSEKLEAKCKNVRTLFRTFDENADGTVSQHEFRKGIENLGIVVTDDEFAELMETLDEDNSNEIDYNEFANSGVMGGKFFAARNPQGFSGQSTKNKLAEKRRMEYKEFADKKVDGFWKQFNTNPAIAARNICIAGGSGSGF